MKTIKEALWEIVRDENIIITNQNIDWLLDRASKKATGDAQALKESILERKGVIEDNIPPTLTNEEKVSEKLLINENKSNNFEVKSNEELFKQALVEGLNRHFDREIEEAKKIEQIEELAKVIDYTFVLAEGVGAVRPSSRMIAMDLYDADFRKQSGGEWIKPYKGVCADPFYTCSACGAGALLTQRVDNSKVVRVLTPYCPHCGAKMKGDKE